MSLGKLTRWIDRQWIGADWNVYRTWLRLLWIAPLLIAVLIIDLFDLPVAGGLAVIVVGAITTALLITWTGWRFFKGYGSTRVSDRMAKYARQVGGDR